MSLVIVAPETVAAAALDVARVAARPLSGRSVTCRRGRGVAGGL
ncbi:hypothetical protein X076_02643 [Mycobacterium tuberculosis BTB04-120]|nr:hypothetical protein X076_02643 [Mycobacterium tuberculosis BTB04-120]